MDLNEFNPVTLSTAENEFLLAHLGEPPVVALRECRLPTTAAVKPILLRVQELEDLHKHEGQTWQGTEVIKESIRQWLKMNAKWAADHKRSKRAPRWPSLASYDARGRAHRGGPGSDAGIVRTYFGPAGERIPFAVPFVADDMPEWVAPGFTEASPDGLLYEDAATNRIECRVPIGDGKICGHTESYKASSRASYSAARGRMSKHLRGATENVDGHRELHTNEFGG